MSQFNNKRALMDSDFLKKLQNKRSREVFVRLISLDFNENPIEQIEGRATGGSINVDGASAVRRTCSITLVAKEMNINDFYWGLNSKFKVEIGLANMVDNRYPDIIWFPQGTYVITSFNTNQTTNNYTVSISGKDKMCLLNGEVGGSLPASIDFGVEEYYDLENNITTKRKIPLKDIIREAVRTYANEPYHNIIIEDLEQAGLELLEYRGENYIYLPYNIALNEYENTTTYGDKKCFLKGEETTIGALTNYYSMVDLIEEATDIVTFEDNDTQYYIARLEYGDAAGYRITDLVYAGELISSIGESLTSILDKIKNMLGDFEYFYDIDGRFIFRKKKVFVNTTFNTIINTQDDKYVENSAYNDQWVYSFEGGNLITAYQNTPNLTNLKNDFSVWGTRKGIDGDELPIHYRYAIDKKPIQYTRITVKAEDIPSDLRNAGVKPRDGGEIYSNTQYDWREIIYQMATDYYQYSRIPNFLFKVMEANGDLYPEGKTGYEQYYIDIISFWRDLYEPNSEPTVFDYTDSITGTGNVSFKFDEEKYPYGLFIKKSYKKYNPSVETGQTPEKIEELRSKVLVLQQNTNGRYEMQPLLTSIKININDIPKTRETIDTTREWYYTINKDKGFSIVTQDIMNRLTKEEIQCSYKDELDKATRLICFINPANNWYVEEEYDEVINIAELLQQDEYKDLERLYKTTEGTEYYNYIPRTKLNIFGEEVENAKINKTYIKYYYKEHEYYQESDELEGVTNLLDYKYWNKKITQAPETLDFWFDLLDTEGELDQFAVYNVGNRPKVINDKDVKSIYFRKVPEILYLPSENSDEYEQAYDLIENANYWHYTRIKGLPLEQFTISAQGKSAQDVVEESLYNYSYCIENINITSIPVYHLIPNTRILVVDDSSKINGEYLVNRISIPLTYNGTMTIGATKAPTRLF